MLTVGDRKIKLKIQGREGERRCWLLIPFHLQEYSSWKNRIGFVCAGEEDIVKLHCFRIISMIGLRV